MTRERAPRFLIGGVTKAGTGTLWSHLRYHPEVFFPQSKEIGFFSKNFFRGPEWYWSHFEGLGPRQQGGEATPNYLWHEASCARIHEYLPDVKLIFSLRNPIERAFSHYWMKVKKGQENRSFTQCIERELAYIERGQKVRCFPYLSIGLYHRHLERFMNHFAREQILVIVFEEFIKDPLVTLRRVYDFIGISPDYEPEDPEAVSNTLTRSTTTLRSKTLLHLFYYGRYPLKPFGLMSPLFKTFYAAVSESLTHLHVRVNLVEGTVPGMPADCRARLGEFYCEDVLSLERMLERKLDAWTACFPSGAHPGYP